MQVRVLYFGVLQERFGTTENHVQLASGTTVGELLNLLRVQTSKQTMDTQLDERLWSTLAVAVNREYSSPNAVLRDGDEVALLPPVSGGGCADDEELALRARIFMPGSPQ